KVVARRLELGEGVGDGVEVRGEAMARRRSQAPVGERAQQLEVSRRTRSLERSDTVTRQLERPRCRDPGIELLERPRSRAARIGEDRLAGFLALPVQRTERLHGQIDLATHLEAGGVRPLAVPQAKR